MHACSVQMQAQVLFFTCKLTGGLQGEHENKENLLFKIPILLILLGLNMTSRVELLNNMLVLNYIIM